MNRLLFAVLLSQLAVGGLVGAPSTPSTPSGNAESDWAAVLALDAGPKAAPSSREEARTLSLAFLERQENALRQFLAGHPSDPRSLDARLRLAHVLASRAELSGQPSLYQAAARLLDETPGTVPEARRADVAFAKLALAMRKVAIPTDADRAALTDRMHAFQRQFPNDRRVAGVMTEVATLYDSQPKRKQALLTEALRLARTDELRARIADDLKRLAMLGQIVALRGKTADGVEVDASQYRGKVVLVCFFAGWSLPSLAGLQETVRLEKQFQPGQIQVIGVSLESSREALDAIVKPLRLGWPVIWDGKGWESPLVRGLAINALPTLWILDKKGHLRTLNGREESEALIRRLLKEN